MDEPDFILASIPLDIVRLVVKFGQESIEGMRLARFICILIYRIEFTKFLEKYRIIISDFPALEQRDCPTTFHCRIVQLAYCQWR